MAFAAACVIPNIGRPFTSKDPAHSGGIGVRLPAPRQKGLGMDLRIAERPIDATTRVIEPHGEIDLATAPNLKAALDAAIDEGARYVLVDFADVAFLDSTGIGVLLSVERKLRARDGALIVVCDDPLIRRVFEISGLTDVLNIRPSRRAALSAAGEFARPTEPQRTIWDRQQPRC
jgi:anti-sigma B factor antagonist